MAVWCGGAWIHTFDRRSPDEALSLEILSTAHVKARFQDLL